MTRAPRVIRLTAAQVVALEQVTTDALRGPDDLGGHRRRVLVAALEKLRAALAADE